MQPDSWLSNILERECFNLKVCDDGQDLDSVISQLSKSGTFATIKLPSEDRQSSFELQQADFLHIEASLSFVLTDCEAKKTLVEESVRFAQPGDKDQVFGIARKAFRYTRFHQDPLIPLETANKVKAEWAANYFSGKRGDYMIVAEHHGMVSGFMQLLSGANSIIIDLIAIDPGLSRHGIARQMINYAILNLGKKFNAEKIIAGTQACNVPSVNLYTSMGFRLQHATNVYHFHGHEKNY